MIIISHSYFCFPQNSECVAEYFEDTGNVTNKEETPGKSQGYKCVLNSKAAEEALVNT